LYDRRLDFAQSLMYTSILKIINFKRKYDKNLQNKSLVARANGITT